MAKKVGKTQRGKAVELRELRTANENKTQNRQAPVKPTRNKGRRDKTRG